MSEVMKMSRYAMRRRVAELMGWRHEKGNGWKWGDPNDTPPKVGRHYAHYGACPEYDKDVTLAWELILLMPMDSLQWQADGWIGVRLVCEDGESFPAVRSVASGPTLPIAACLAFLEYKLGKRIEVVRN